MYYLPNLLPFFVISKQDLQAPGWPRLEIASRLFSNKQNSVWAVKFDQEML
jgi:hypothetical protein